MIGGAELAAAMSGLLPGYEPRYAYLLLSRLLGNSKALVICLAEVLVLSTALSIVAEKAWILLTRLSRRSRILGVLVERILAARESAERLVNRYGVIGLSVFVAVPLPITGIYTGSIVAMLLGLSRRQAILSLSIGGASSVIIVAVLNELGGRLIA